MSRNLWYVVDTPCYPNQWKVINDYYRMDNATCRYFADKADANKEAETRNKREVI